ncbi:unnamed protein product, partial [Porites lobata]
RYLSKGEVEQELREVKKLQRNCKDREKYWRVKCEEFIEMEEADHTDLCNMFHTENIEMVHRNGKHKLVGFVNLGETHDIMSKISDGTSSPHDQLATHVLQFIFLSDNGFRFPIAQFPSASCTPSALYYLFWEGVIKMQEYGFVIYWCLLDGADVNRQFIKLHFKDQDPVEKKFVVENIFTGNPMVFIMDPKHNIKKIRNNILKSNDITKKPRCLQKGNKTITWAQFKAAYDWDQNSFSLPLHEKLTLQHFELDPSSKMRNHLAENVLDSKMLFLMQKYQENLNEGGKDGSALDATIELLSHTSNIVGLFGDKLFISSTSDSRLAKLDNFYKFMMNWREETKDSNNSFISSKLFFDLQSMCLGFQAIVHLKLTRFPSSAIKPAIVNQDVAENHFCQIRACNGQNNNPTFAQQQSTQNSIRLGQTTISRKSNAGNLSTSNFTSCSLPMSCSKKS